MPTQPTAINIPLGIGFYTTSEAAQLVRMPAQKIRRWLSGHNYKIGDELRSMPALWAPQLPKFDNHQELGFRDLVELRFVNAFVKQGLGLSTIRRCLNYARDCIADEHPFSTRQFRTDGRTIFFDFVEQANAVAATSNDNQSDDELRSLLDLKHRQFVFRNVVSQTFKDLDFDERIVTRWRLLAGKDSIVIDPRRAFGQPIAAGTGTPTVALDQAVKAEGSVSRVAFLFDLPLQVVRDAMKFEAELRAA